jgi:hypothetical protein
VSDASSVYIWAESWGELETLGKEIQRAIAAGWMTHRNATLKDADPVADAEDRGRLADADALDEHTR